MLLSAKESILKLSEWENLEYFGNNTIVSKEQLCASKTGYWNEYDKLSNVLQNEYAKHTEFFFKFQKSNIDILSNYLSIWKNFYSCCFEQNKRLHDYYLKNKSD